MRLLIVEDEPMIAADLESVAADLGHVVVGVANSRVAALAMAEAHAPQAALIDIKLKDGFTGPDIAQALGARLNLPFAFVSGNAEMLPPDAFGAVAVIQKPFTDEQIAGVLTSLARRC